MPSSTRRSPSSRIDFNPAPCAAVAIFASGGLSHTVIEEELDQAIIKGLMNDDVKQLTDWTDVRFRAGTSEIKNWIALAGAMSGTRLTSSASSGT